MSTRELPGPRGWRLVGTFASLLQGDLLKPFVRLFERYGPLFRIPLPLDHDLVMLAHPDADQTLLGAYMDARDPDTDEAMRDRQLRDEVVTLYLAGHETTASLLTWALYWLARRPNIAERVTAEIDRQAASSKIILNAHRINRGQMPERSEKAEGDFYFIGSDTPEDIHDKLLQVVTERIPKRFGLHPIDDIQVLTPMNRGGLGARSFNVELQQRLNPRSEPRVTRFGWTYAPADKVIQTVNNYDKDVFNGDIGRVVKIDEEEGLVFIDYDGRRVEYETGELDEISLAYATTVHKSQGSEYPAVVIPLGMQHYMLLERNLLYTAVTRGKRLVVVIGQTKALAMAVKRLGSVKRLTNLQARLRQASKGQEHGI